MEPVNVENEPDIPEPLPLVTLKVALSVLDTSPDEEESVFVTDAMDPSTPLTEMEAFPVWSLDKDAWRSFRLDTVESWEVING